MKNGGLRRRCKVTVIKRARAWLSRPGSSLAVALLLGRLSGLLRELLLASRFGVSRQADVAVVLLTLPDLLVNLLISGGLSAALVPRLRAASAEDAVALFQHVARWTVLFFGLLALVVALRPDGIFGLLAPGLSGVSSVAGHAALAMLALSIPITALSGVTAAYLNARDRYFVVGLGTLIFNAAVILGLAGHVPGPAMTILAAAILMGAGLRLASQTALLPRRSWHRTARSEGLSPDFRRAFAAGILAASLALVPPAIVRAAASLLASGNIASFNYAQKLVELPLGILITTISTIALTRLSQHHAAGDEQAARRTLTANLRLSLLLASLIVVLGELLATRVVSLLFLRGAVGIDGVSRITALTRVALLGIPFAAVSSLATASLNAQRRIAEVLRCTLICIIVLVGLIIPGLIVRQEPLLMAAVVGSQIALATLLARKARICVGGDDGVGSPRLYIALATGAAIVFPFGVAGMLLPLGHDVSAVAIGGVGFALALGAANAVLTKG